MGEFDGGAFSGVDAGADSRGMRLLLCTLALAAVVGTGLAEALPNINPANRLANVPIDDYRYDHATHCERNPKAGTVALQRWLQQNAAGVSWGIMRCEKWGKNSASLHAEGRAIETPAGEVRIPMFGLTLQVEVDGLVEQLPDLLQGAVEAAAVADVATPFAQPRAFGNARPNQRSLYTYAAGFVFGNSAWDARPASQAAWQKFDSKGRPTGNVDTYGNRRNN